MDLNKADPKQVASLILNGRLQLDEVPMLRKRLVAIQIETLKAETAAKAEAEAKAKAAAKKPKPKPKPKAKKAAKGKKNDKK